MQFGEERPLLLLALLSESSGFPISGKTVEIYDSYIATTDLKKFYKEAGSIKKRLYDIISVDYLNEKILDQFKEELESALAAFRHESQRSSQLIKSMLGKKFDIRKVVIEAHLNQLRGDIEHMAGCSVWDINLESVAGSRILNVQHDSYYFRTATTDFMRKLPPLSSRKFLSLENNSCYCDTLLQYLFGFTDLFDFGFKYWNRFPNMNYDSADVTTRQKLFDMTHGTDEQKLFLTRFSSQNPSFLQDLPFISLDSSDFIFHYDRIQELIHVCNWIRGEDGKYKKEMSSVRSYVKDIFDKKYYNTDYDYEEFYKSICSLIGISSQISPKMLLTIRQKHNRQKYKILELMIALDNVNIRKAVSNIYRKDEIDALDPSKTISFLEQGEEYDSMVSFVSSFSFETVITVDNSNVSWLGERTYSIDSYLKKKKLVADFQLINLPNIFFWALNPKDTTLNSRSRGTPGDPFKKIKKQEDLHLLNNPIEIRALEGTDLYYLTCVVFHGGGGTGGHYTMIARDPMTKAWIGFNDADVLSNKNYQGTFYDFSKKATDNTRLVSELKKKTYGIWYTKKSVFDMYNKS